MHIDRGTSRSAPRVLIPGQGRTVFEAFDAMQHREIDLVHVKHVISVLSLTWGKTVLVFRAVESHPLPELYEQYIREQNPVYT